MGKNSSRAVALALQLVPIALPARAETTSVRLDVPCPIAGTPVDAVAEILRAQLAPMQIVVSTPAAPPPTATLQVTMDACNATSAELEIIVVHGEVRSAQRIDLGDVALNARSRTLALAVAESVLHALDAPDEAAGAAGSNASFSPESVEGAAASAAGTGSKAPADPEPARQPAERPKPAAAAEPASPDGGVRSQELIDFALEASPFVRYAFRTSTPYFGLDAGVGLRRYSFHLRLLANRRSAQDTSVWQGALLAGVAAEWLRLTRASIRSEFELGAALAVPESVESSIAQSALGPHMGGATYLRLLSPVAKHWFFESELGVGVAASLTAQAYHTDLMSLSGFFVQTSFGVGWSALPL